MEVNRKLTQIFKFLQEYNHLKNPQKKNIKDHLWHMWLDELPDHNLIDFNFKDDVTKESAEEYVLKVRKPKITYCPELPVHLENWLELGWENPFLESKKILSKYEKDIDGNQVEVKFEDNEMRVKSFDSWFLQRCEWAGKEKPIREVLKIYNSLYDLHTKIEQESEKVELLLGDGIFKTNFITEDNVNHPLLLKKVRIEFNPEIPEFTIEEIFTALEFYTGALREIKSISPAVISDVREQLEQNEYHPLEKDNTTNFLKCLLEKITTKGKFVDFEEQYNGSEEFMIQRRPVLLLRTRTSGFGFAIEAILEDIKDKEIFPQSLTSILGIDSGKKAENFDEESNKFEIVNGIDEKILFSKDANEEQLLIAKRIEKNGAVLVQGPPGTGKTHTIANLIGHLLSQGKTVLVSSHTSKALSVLHEKIVPKLQPLCVSLLNDSNEQLERAVSGITEYMSSTNEEQLIKDAKSIQAHRMDIIGELRIERIKLLNAKKDEVRSIVLAGEEITPATAGKFIFEHAERSSWIPGPVKALVSIPLSNEEVVSLYQSNETVSQADELILQHALPETNILLEPIDFEKLLKERNALIDSNVDQLIEYWDVEIEKRNKNDLQDILAKVTSLIRDIKNISNWKATAMIAGIEGGIEKKTWETLINKIEDSYIDASQNIEINLECTPIYPENLTPEKAYEILEQITSEVTSKGKISLTKKLFNKEWKDIIENSRVKNAPPKSSQDFAALLSIAQLHMKRNQLKIYWDKHITQNKGPQFIELGNEPEKVCRKYCVEIENCLSWYEVKWRPLEQEMKKIGFLWDRMFVEHQNNYMPEGQFEDIRNFVSTILPSAIESENSRIRLRDIENKITQLNQYVEGLEENEVSIGLKNAIKDLDPQKYNAVYTRIINLKETMNYLNQRKNALLKLSEVAPIWSMHIQKRIDKHGASLVPGNIEDAWKWIQLSQEIDTRNSVSIDEIQQRINLLNAKLKETSSSLIEKKAWAKQHERTNQEQRTALNGWKDTIKRIGKRTGVRVPRYIAEAKKQMLQCQTAVPVWIMPLNRVVENFVPGKNKFDVVIVDEASQADILSLPLLYMGEKIIVVGDDKQVTPDSVGMKIDGVDRLIDTYLEGIPNKLLYDEKTSLYHIAGRSFEPICLREHFRCVSPIIQFSNYLCYDGKIKPLRDESDIQVKPHTVAYRVKDAYSDEKVNQVEAIEVASLICACIEQKEYEKMTFGVISMVGDEQAEIIRNILMRRMSETDYISRKIQCGNPAQFQGDERDVCFLSMVDSPKGEGPMALRTREANDERYGKRFNVAASRAKNQLWVVYSMNSDIDLKPDDIRLRLIQHAKDPYAREKCYEEKVVFAESEFEKLVLKRLLNEGFDVIPQWKVGSYRIDMIVKSGNKKIALECDGEKYHSGEKIEEDMVRQSLLERLGWKFIRIRGSQYFKDPEGTMEKVINQLKENDITVIGGNKNCSVEEEQYELKNRVIRRAEEIRTAWKEAPIDYSEDKTRSKGGYFARKIKKSNEGNCDNSGKSGSYINQADSYNNSESKDCKQIGVNLSESLNQDHREFENKGTPNVVITRVENANSLNKSSEDLRKAIPVSTRKIPDNVGKKFDIAPMLIRKGFEVIDKREKGGALWIVGGKELENVLRSFNKYNYYFTFAPNGGTATKQRPGWFVR